MKIMLRRKGKTLNIENSIDITDNALDKIINVMNEEENPDLKLRLYISGGGCSGFNYLFEPTDSPDDEDIVFCDSPKSVIDPESLKFLYGSTIDLEDSGMNKMLKVENPGARASCGCGTSFAFDEDLLDLYENV